MAKTVLVLAAHPDDEVLGCGGTIARLAREGREVHIAILGEGASSRYHERGSVEPDELAELKSASQRSGLILGAHFVHSFGLPDNRFDSVDLLDIVKVIEELIRNLNPSVVYTQHGGDLNIDHQLLYRATLAATRPQPHCQVAQVLSYEVASSTEWSFHQFSPHFHPNVFVDVSDTLELKLRAMCEYESEIRQTPHPRSLEVLRASAQRWGSVIGVTAAEAFCLVREIR